MSSNNSTFDKNFWKSFRWFVLVASLICCLPWLLAKHSGIDFTSTGPIGDTIGGIMGPFIAIAAAGLTFIAFWVQYKANIQQRHDIAIERFESNLFEMIHIQQEITNGLLVDYINETKNNREISRGREVFRKIYLDFKDRVIFPDGEDSQILFKALEDWPDLKMHLSAVKIMWNLDHYFRHLYRIFKYINDADLTLIPDFKKYEYASIVRATLSEYELVLLFYNGFSHPRFKGLIEEYALLNNLRPELLATKSDRVLYKTKMAETAVFLDEDNNNMSSEYNQSAFIWKKKVNQYK